MSDKVKIGDTFAYEYKRTEKQFKIGQRVRLGNLAFVVETTNAIQATGKVINTYGHKRKSHRLADAVKA